MKQWTLASCNSCCACILGATAQHGALEWPVAGPTVPAAWRFKSVGQCRGPFSLRRQSPLSRRPAASAVSSGRVLKAIAAFGAALWMMFTTDSNSARLLGGSLRPPPITTQS